MLKRFIFVFFLSSLLSLPSWAGNDATGTDSGAYLKITGGVRAAGLGDTYTGLADDPNAIFWNPAGLTQLKTAEFNSMYTSWFQEISFANISYAKPLGNNNALGFSVTYLSAGLLEETTLVDPGGTGNYFNPSDVVMTISFARKINNRLSIGSSYKFINDTIGSSIATGFGLDLGILYQTPVNKLNLGAVVRNMGRLANDSLPTIFSMGLSYKMLENDKLALVCDINLPNDNDPSIHFGAEYYVVPCFCLRAGANTKSEENAGGKYGVGLGFNYMGTAIDYAYAPFGDLGETHRLSLNMKL